MRWSSSHILRTLSLIIVVGVATINCGDRDEQPIADVSNKVLPEIEETSGSISGQIKLKDAQDNSGIVVFCAGTSFFAFTDEQGNYLIADVPYGTYEVRVQKEGYLGEKLGTVTIAANSPLKSSEVILKPSLVRSPFCLISGKVILTGQLFSSDVVVQLDRTDYKTITDTNGAYTFPTIPPGEYKLVFSKLNFEQQTEVVKVSEGQSLRVKNVTLEPIPVETKRFISGIVEMYDEKQERADDYDSVFITLEGTNYMATPDEAGNFMFHNLPKTGYVLSAKALGYVLREKIEIDLINELSITVVVVLDMDLEKRDDVGILTGIVTLETPEDEEIDNSGIIVGLAGTAYMAFSDQDGIFTIDYIPVGKYTFIAQAEGYITHMYPDLEISRDEETNISGVELALQVFPPEVLYTSPADGESDVMIEKEIPVFVRFSKNMNPATVKGAFSISPSVDYQLLMGKENPDSDFDLLLVKIFGTSEENPAKYNSTYTITIGDSASDYEGLTLEVPYSFSFSTGRALIVATKPADGDKGVLVGYRTPIEVYFNGEIDFSTLSKRTVKITPAPPASMEFQRYSPYSDRGWSQLMVYVDLEPGTKYTVTLSSGIRTTGGSRLSNTPYKFSFTTSKLVEPKPPDIRTE